MTATLVQLPRTLEMLIESRLDTIDRMLVERVPRQDRLAIVREVESQIYDLLQAGEHEEHTRESVLEVLARLDPPEAYLPDEITGEAARPAQSISPRGRVVPTTQQQNSNAARASGILGLVALFLILLSPLPYALGMALRSEIVMLVGWGGEMLAVFTASVIAIVLGIYARFRGAWAIVGVATSSLSIFAVIGGSAVLFALILGG
jgi:hypothetical protein